VKFTSELREVYHYCTIFEETLKIGLENYVKVTQVPFDRSHTSSYSCSIVMALSCIVSEILNVE